MFYVDEEGPYLRYINTFSDDESFAPKGERSRELHHDIQEDKVKFNLEYVDSVFINGAPTMVKLLLHISTKVFWVTYDWKIPHHLLRGRSGFCPDAPVRPDQSAAVAGNGGKSLRLFH